MSDAQKMADTMRECARELLALDLGALSFHVGLVLGAAQKRSSLTQSEAVSLVIPLTEEVHRQLIGIAGLDS